VWRSAIAAGLQPSSLCTRWWYSSTQPSITSCSCCGRQAQLDDRVLLAEALGEAQGRVDRLALLDAVADEAAQHREQVVQHRALHALDVALLLGAERRALLVVIFRA
jgi:hypothetical protein